MSNIKTTRNLEIARQLMGGLTEREIARLHKIRPSRVGKIKQDILARIANNYGVSRRSMPRKVIPK